MKPLVSVSEDENKLPKSFPLKIYILFRSVFDNLTGGSANFLISFLNYLFQRVRMTVIYGDVSLSVLSGYITEAKETMTKGMFWGRSPLYRYAVQVFAVIFLVAFVSIQLVKEPQLTVNAQTVHVESIAVAENDLLVETGSTQTLIAKSGGRLDTREYVVQGGDTLSGIADKFDLKLTTILWANKLNATSVIKPGDILKILEGDGVPHKIKSGDTLESIAKKYSSNATAIASYNWEVIDDPDKLPVGADIFVPNGQIKVPSTLVAKTTSSTSSSSTGYIPYSGGGGGTDPANGTFLWPVSGGRGRVTQCPSWYHKAIDIADKTYPNIVAARSGTIAFAGVKDPYGYGREIVISHGGGLYTQYAHLSSWAVTSGQRVAAGQVIGRMGRSGRSTGVHLHWEVRKGGPWYSNRVSAPQYYLSTRVCR